jgi:four helix bundle protein
MEDKNIIKTKSFEFAVRIVKLYKHISETKKEYTLTKQLLRCGTSIGANVSEAQNAESKADFIHKLAIAQKEATETIYWLELLQTTDYLSVTEFNSIHNDAIELIKLLTTIIKTSKVNRHNNN